MHRRELMIALGAALAACRLRYRPSEPRALDAHELATVAAIAETFLPGGTGAPGARDVEAVATIVEPAHGLAPYLAELVADLDQWCLATRFVAFRGLAAADRTRALEQRLGDAGGAIRSWYAPAYQALLALAKLALCEHPLGAAYLGFPGASLGYAPRSAAGAHASRDRPWRLAPGRASAIEVAGSGRVARAVAHAVVTSTGPVRARLRIHAPGGRHHELAVAGEDHVRITGAPLALAGAVAAGTWRLEIAAVAGAARLELWALVLRTELDDAAAT